MPHWPVVLDRGDLDTLLDDILTGFRQGDTLEGFVGFMMSLDAPKKWGVVARYRTGQRQGQGGLRVVGKLEGDGRTWTDEDKRALVDAIQHEFHEDYEGEWDLDDVDTQLALCLGGLQKWIGVASAARAFESQVQDALGRTG